VTGHYVPEQWTDTWIRCWGPLDEGCAGLLNGRDVMAKLGTEDGTCCRPL
jgi:hypothetical protein